MFRPYSESREAGFVTRRADELPAYITRMRLLSLRQLLVGVPKPVLFAEWQLPQLTVS